MPATDWSPLPHAGPIDTEDGRTVDVNIGLKPGDPAYENALKFITRDQNNSETNKDAKWAGDDGGFIYSPANDGESMRWRFTLISPSRGMAGGGEGRCELSDSRREISAEFPRH